MTAPDIEGLVERLAALSGPDREVDEAIMAALFVRDERHTGVMEVSGDDDNWRAVKSKVWVDPKTDQWVSTHAHCFTSSIDAALALVPIDPAPTREPKPLPWKLGYSRHVPCVAEIKTARGVALGECDSNHAIALCIGALRARAQADEDER